MFLFTSALPTEGKSFTSVNYALALAQQGHRVLLIDGDLRRPSIHKVFQLGSNGEGRLRSDEMMGIVDYLVGAAELRDAARTVLTTDTVTLVDRTNRGTASRRGELSILAGGRRAPNPAELLSGHSFRELLTEAAEHYDRVVIDSAPILAVSDTLLMVPYVQTSCMVVRANRTPRNAASRALSLLAAAGTRPAGVILNRLPRRRGTGIHSTRRATAGLVLEPAQGAVPRGRLHQGRGGRVLPAHRRHAPAPSEEPGADAQALPQRR